MRTAHILRKYRPDEWGGTETAVLRLLDGLKNRQVESTVFAPAVNLLASDDPFVRSGHQVKRFKAFLPVSGIGVAERAQLLSNGGNLMSLELPRRLLTLPGLNVIHTHAMNRLGGIALRIARIRKLPCVLTIHGGCLDLPQKVRETLAAPLRGGFEWGKIFGPLLRSRHVVEEVDAVVTCNPREAELLRQRYPKQRVVVQPHGVPMASFHEDHRAEAQAAFPDVKGKRVLLVLGRIDPVKNQGWAVSQFKSILGKHPDALLVIAGAPTDEQYAKTLKKDIRRLGMEEHVLLTGGLPPLQPVLLGLLQLAGVVIVPSLSETFGLTILESWAAARPVLSTNTSGAQSLIQDRQNGLLFDLAHPAAFHEKLLAVLDNPNWARSLGEAGRVRAAAEFDTGVLSARIKSLYDELISLKKP